MQRLFSLFRTNLNLTTPSTLKVHFVLIGRCVSGLKLTAAAEQKPFPLREAFNRRLLLLAVPLSFISIRGSISFTLCAGLHVRDGLLSPGRRNIDACRNRAATRLHSRGKEVACCHIICGLKKKKKAFPANNHLQM